MRKRAEISKRFLIAFGAMILITIFFIYLPSKRGSIAREEGVDSGQVVQLESGYPIAISYAVLWQAMEAIIGGDKKAYSNLSNQGLVRITKAGEKAYYIGIEDEGMVIKLKTRGSSQVYYTVREAVRSSSSSFPFSQ